MLDSRLLAFLVVAALLTMTPGADTMLVFRNVLRGGGRAGISTTLGICSGVFAHATISALGLSVILMRSAELYAAVKLAGALYLIWLGASSLREAWEKAPAGESGENEPLPGDAPSGDRPVFLQGLMTNVLNPKVAVFYLAFLPQFIGPDDPVFARSMLLAAIHAVMGVVWLSSLSLALDRARTVLTRGSVRRWMDAVAGTVLVGFGLRLALAKD